MRLTSSMLTFVELDSCEREILLCQWKIKSDCSVLIIAEFLSLDQPLPMEKEVQLRIMYAMTGNNAVLVLSLHNWGVTAK